MSAKKEKARNLQESDLAQDVMGNNTLQGNDQRSVRNERHALPREKDEADSVIESFEKLEKGKRAHTDLGKGNRSDPEETQAD